MKKPYILILMAAFINACTEEIQIEFPENNPKLTVEAIITNTPGPYYVRLSLSRPTFEKPTINDSIQETWLFDGFEPVTNAKVVISDNLGNIDSLIPSPDSIYIKDFYSENPTDSVYVINYKGNFLGYYQTSTLVGKPGNTYYLSIFWNNKVFTSTCYMPYVPTIDSITYSFTFGAPGKPDFYIPHIWFKDNPATKDYYLFETSGGGNRVWARAVLSDEYMKSDIDGLDVFKGESIDWWMKAYPYYSEVFEIKMSSISSEIYDYYCALITQFRNDGGVFTPTPATPPTNISNGGLGYFSAASFQIVRDTMPYPPAR